jgi:hypothetical protein
MDIIVFLHHMCRRRHEILPSPALSRDSAVRAIIAKMSILVSQREQPING